MKKYRIEIELDYFEVVVTAKNKREAKRKAIEKLRAKDIYKLIRRTWPDNKQRISFECVD